MTSLRRLLVSTAALATLVSGVGAAVPAEAAKPRPDLVVSAGSLGPRTVVAGSGAVVRVGWTVRNTGRALARPSVLRVDLVGAGRVVPLRTARVAALGRGRATRPSTAAVRVPPSTTAGSYQVRACADVTRRVAERDERNNCRVVGVLRVAARPTPPAPPAQPVPTIPRMEPGPRVLDSFAVTTTWPDGDELVPAVQAGCRLTRPVRPVTFAAALAALHAHLRAEAPDGVRRLAASPQYGDPVALQQLAAAGVVNNGPGLALAALLRAAELEPTIGTHLVNAAAIATSIGMPNEAIALLDTAATRTYRAPAMGVPIQAVAATVRGQALVVTGRLEQARPWFEAARRAAPLLTEAEAGLATVEACAGRTARAARSIEKAQVRTHTETPVDAPAVTVDPMEHLDLDHGRKTPLRRLPMAQSPTQLVAMYDTYLDIGWGMVGEIDRVGQAKEAAETALDVVDEHSSIAEQLRRGSLVWLGQSATTPAADEAEVEIERIKDRLRETNDEFWNHDDGTFAELLDEAVEACNGSTDQHCATKYVNGRCRPALAAEHRRWVVLMNDLESASAVRMAELSELRSAVAANLATEPAHELVLLDIAELERQLFSDVNHQALMWASTAKTFAGLCVEELPADVLNPPAKADPASSGACPPGIAAISYKLALGPVEMKAGCEKVSVEVSGPFAPLLHAFLEVGYEFRSGTMTVVAGSKVKIGGGALEGSFKSGAYVSMDTRQGTFKDVGWQVGREVTASAAGIELAPYKNEVDFSFLSGLPSGT